MKLMRFQNRKWSASAAGTILLILSVLLQLSARNIPGFGQWYAVTIYPVLVWLFGHISGFFPFSVSEVFLYAMILAFLFYGIHFLGQWKKIVIGTLLLLSVLFFLYTVNCGINYYRRPFSDYLNYKTDVYTQEELKEFCFWLTDEVNKAYTGTAQMETEKVQTEGVKAMERLGNTYSQLDGYYPRPKPLLISRLLSIQRLSGIYSPFSVEANYNNEMIAYNIPHTICHELSHLKGFMREDEANFIGFLACIGAESEAYRYSGYLMGWIYAGNALAESDLETYWECWDRLRPEIKEELRANSQFWDRFDTKLSEAAETMNDTYLKANDQSDGLKSYGRMVDLMLAWYRYGH